MSLQIDRAVVVAPHPDDETIGCGGTIRRLVEDGARVSVVFLTSGELGLKHLDPDVARSTREREAEEAAAVLGVHELRFLRLPDWHLSTAGAAATTALAAALRAAAPSTVFVPHPSEWHPDHATSAGLLRAALETSGAPPPDVLTYEVWTPIACPDEIHDVTGQMRVKLRAIRRYVSQLNGIRYDRAVRGLNSYRGEMNRRGRYGEAFERLAFPDSRATDG